jgi:hypothetical protein
MIPVRMRDDGRLHRLPGVNEEIAERAVQAATGGGNEGFGFRAHGWMARIAQDAFEGATIIGSASRRVIFNRA